MKRIALCLAAWLSCTAQAAPPEARTAQGRVRGEILGDLAVFKGLPFAAPPVGDLRWRPPAPAMSWKGVRQTTRFSADCMQVPPKPGSRDDQPGRHFSEDCLYLNIWAPKGGRNLPIMLWIHGGSFTHGGASLSVYDGARLARRGIIVVTINYRLGPLGFMAHPGLTSEAGASGNYGIMDQFAALKWVNANIRAFGGDPGRVTIAGNSAGAISVNALMAALSARGLFAGAIVQSGPLWGMSPPTRQRADLEALGLRMMQSRGLTTIAQMRALPAEALLELTPDEAKGLPLPFGPITDRKLLISPPAEQFIKGEQAPVPLMIGDTADEFSMFVPATLTPPAYEREMRAEFAAEADRYIALFPHGSGTDARRARVQSRVYPIHDGTISEAELHARRYPTYVFRFDQVPPGPDAARLGAAHGSEVAYMFDAVEGTDTDRKVAGAMADLWANFVKTGNPNAPGAPTWPSFNADKPMLMRFGDPVEAMPLLDRERMRAARRPHDVEWLKRLTPR